MERQKIGFNLEDEFIRINNLFKSESYIAEFDAYDKKGSLYQFKTYKKNCMLMMGDLRRYLNHKKPFYLVVVERDNYGACISTKVVFIDPNGKFKTFLKNERAEERLNDAKNLLNSVTNNYKDDKKFRESFKILKQKYRPGSLIQVQAKRDHKHQKRVQWAIANKNIDTFLNEIAEKPIETHYKTLNIH